MTWRGTAITDLEDHIMHLVRQKHVLRAALEDAMEQRKGWKEQARKAIEDSRRQWSRG